MADNRWNDDDYRRDDRRGWAERAGDEVRSWFGDDEARMRRGNDERHGRYAYGGERSWRDQGNAREDRGQWSGSSNWRGARDFGGYEEGSRGGSNWGEGEGGHGYGRGSAHERASYWGRGAQEHGPAAQDYSRGDWGRDDGRGDREEYGRGGQYGATSYDRGQLRRTYSDWTPGAAAGARDWEGRESGEWRERSGSNVERSGGWGRENYAGRGPKGYRRSDERIREDVSDALTADPLVDASEIVVEIESGHVTLSGTVLARDQKRRAEDVAERVSGVIDVTNNLRVNKQDSARPDDRQDVSRIVTPSVVAPEGENQR